MPTPARTVLVALVAVLAMRTAAAASPPSLYDVPALEAFLDGAVEALLETREVPGISVAIVKEGRVLLVKGYGVASLESGSAVSADRTLFRIGSVSKTFLATAIMQLVEQGKLDLETDVNVYLDGVHVPDTFAEPVTLTHVMTHTSGFEESTLGKLWADSAAEIPPLVNELAGYLPARVRPPGELVAYSNHATAIAALVVQQVSGIPYDEYLEQNIFGPLGMKHTTSRQPPPASIDAELSTGSESPGYFAYVRIPPAGSISSTATDMARYMIAHLQLGRLGQARILREPTARRMQGRLFSHDPRVNGFAHQFIEYDANGQRIFGHGGGTRHHITQLAFLPEHGVGFFASQNAQNGAVFELWRLFLDRYFPAGEAVPQPMPDAAERLDRYTGWYRHSRAGVRNPTKLVHFLTMQPARAGSDARLRFLDEEWVEVDPRFFRRVDGKDHLVFADGADGKVARAYHNGDATSVLLKRPWVEGRTFQFLIPGLALVIVLFPILHRPLARWRAWVRRVAAGGLGAFERCVSAGLRLGIAGFALTFGIGAVIAARTADASPFLVISFIVAYTIAPMGLVAALLAGIAWLQTAGSVAERCGLSLLAAASLALGWWIEHWNLLLHRL